MNKRNVILKTAKGTINGSTERTEEELQKEIKSLSEKELETVCAAMEAAYTDIDDCLSDLKKGYVYLTGSKNLKEQAEKIVDTEDIRPDWIKAYIDVNELAKDLNCDKYYETEYGVLWVD